MITVRIRQERNGAVHVVRVTAPSIERALEIVPGNVIFPIDPDEAFAPAGSREWIERGEF